MKGRGCSGSGDDEEESNENRHAHDDDTIWMLAKIQATTESTSNVQDSIDRVRHSCRLGLVEVDAKSDQAADSASEGSKDPLPGDELEYSTVSFSTTRYLPC